MQNSIVSFFLLAVLVAFQTSLSAQENISSAGGDASGSGGSVSYSVGQIICSTNSGSNGSVSEGVQQPYEISVVSINSDFPEVDLICTVFPNPASDYLTLKTENTEINSLNYSLYNSLSQIIESNFLSTGETHIDMKSLVKGVYFLKVMKDSEEIKSFKIIKN